MHRRFFTPYLILCAFSAVVFSIVTLRNFSYQPDSRLFLLFALLLLNANHQVKHDSGSFSINFPLLFPVIAFFGPGWASVLAFLGLISLDEFDDNSWPVFLFNRGSLGLAAGTSALIFHSLGGLDNLVVSLLLCTITYSLVNAILFIIARQLMDPGSNNLSAVWETQKTLIPSSALAAFFSFAYQAFDIFGIIGVYYIFRTIRSGALFGHLEVNYRISLIRSLLRAVYAKDPDLMQHLENVAHYSKKLAQKCGYPRWKLQLLDEASYFHDIGKLEISDLILKKPGRLTDLEYFEMKKHPTKGMEFLKEIPLPRSHKEMVANIANYHHERYDGQGYPLSLKGEEIPLEARIVSIADTWDAMVGARCYRKPLSTADALAELRRVAGTQLDPKLVQVFITIIEEETLVNPNLFSQTATKPIAK